MAYKDYRRRIERLQEYIKRECTGDVEELSDKLGVSRRTLFYYMEILRDTGLVIKFDRYRNTYYYGN